ncbi:MAG: hypothetical protein RMJ56_18420 [Gemmataceae bacterium]|nr:hypothetical protein [Gemmata sp.]MDW8199573.1 hypothetical protein [Gemmataceae bacterium]
MNCQTVQNQILALPDPRDIPAALQQHVLHCAACHAWAQQAARLEALVAQLPVPPAPGQKKDALLGELISAEPLIQPPARLTALYRSASDSRRFLRRNTMYLSGLAAAILVAVAVYSFTPRPHRHQHDEVTQAEDYPLLRKIVHGNTALARADSLPRKLEVLAQMADDIAADTRGMARIASGDELRDMAGWYEKIVKDGLASQARELRKQPVGIPEAEKTRLLESYAARLQADARMTEQLLQEVPPESQRALRRLLEAAREGEKTLRGQ